MRLAVLGASGGCGKWLTRLAAQQGHDVTALVRPSTPFQPPPGVDVYRGSALDPSDLRRVVQDRDAVISCIGSRRTNPLNPWAPLQSPGPITEHCTRAAVEVLQSSGVRRLVAISAAGVGDSATLANPVISWLVRHSTVGTMYADLDAMEHVLAQSRLDWLAVRPVTLVNAPPSNRTKIVERFRTVSVVGRADVAAWLLRAATDPAPILNRTPMIGWW